jgi:ABC-type transport system involved in multi-copper enzyme maturation permease subunit
MSGHIAGWVWRRARVGLMLAILLPLLVGTINGLAWPVWSKEREVLRPVLTRLRHFVRTDVADVDIFTPEGAFMIPFQHPLSLLSCAVAMAVLTLPILAGERGRGGLEILLVTRLTRRGLLWGVLRAALPVALCFGHGPLLGTCLGAALVGETGDLPFAIYECMALQLGLLAAWLMALGILIGTWASDGAKALRTYVLVVAISFVLDFTSHAMKGWDAIKYFSPLGWYDPGEMLQRGSMVPTSVAVLAVSAALMFAASLRIADQRRSA